MITENGQIILNGDGLGRYNPDRKLLMVVTGFTFVPDDNERDKDNWALVNIKDWILENFQDSFREYGLEISSTASRDKWKALAEDMYSRRAMYDARSDRVLCAFCHGILFENKHTPDCPAIPHQLLIEEDTK